MGSPPDMHIIVAVCDFLLYVHPAANTYISCTQSGFYFKLWWGKEFISEELNPQKYSIQGNIYSLFIFVPFAAILSGRI